MSFTPSTALREIITLVHMIEPYEATHLCRERFRLEKGECVALVRSTCVCVSKASHMSSRSLDLTAQATRLSQLSDPCLRSERSRRGGQEGAGFSGRTLEFSALSHLGPVDTPYSLTR